MKIFFIFLLFVVSIGFPAMAGRKAAADENAKGEAAEGEGGKGKAAQVEGRKGKAADGEGAKIEADASADAKDETAEQKVSQDKSAVTDEACPKRPRRKRKARKLAGDWFSKASKLVEDKRFADAVDAFRCSFQIVAHPATLINGAKAAALAEDYHTALDLLGIYLEQYPDDDKVEDVKKQVADLEAKKKQQDEERAAEEAQRGQELETTEQSAGLAEKEERDRILAKERGKKIAGYVLLGAGGAGLVVGAVLQGLAGAAYEKGQDTEDPRVFMESENDMKKYQAAAIGAFAGGGAALIAGIVILLVTKKEPKAEDLSILPTADGLMIRGTF